MRYTPRHSGASKRVKRIATVGLTTAALAMGGGIAAAGSANAASVGTWDKVAACESGGRWNIATGNGYYGGLQFSRSTWLGYGGGAYAPTANRASKAQQIAIAERVLAGQGPGAWPVCSRRAGLTRGGAAPASRSTVRKAVAKKVVKKRVVKKKRYVAKKRYVLKKRYTRSGKRYYVRVYVRR